MSESNPLCPSCSENEKSFADVPLENPEEYYCAETFSTDCVTYDGVAHPSLNILPGTNLTDVIGILALSEGVTPLVVVNTENTDYITFTGDGRISSPIQAFLTLDRKFANDFMDALILNSTSLAILDGYVTDALLNGNVPTAQGCIVTATTFTRIFTTGNNVAAGTHYGLQDQDGSAQYEFEIWDQTTGFSGGYVSAGIRTIGGDKELFSSAQRGLTVKWKFRKYCGIDQAGSQVFSSWVQGPDILPF
jgi:hypothetical protein